MAGIWPLVSARNAEFLANEVPGVVVPATSPGAHAPRQRRAARRPAVEEGIRIAQEMLAEARPRIQGVQVSAPFGKVALALRGLRGARRLERADAGGRRLRRA